MKKNRRQAQRVGSRQTTPTKPQSGRRGATETSTNLVGQLSSLLRHHRLLFTGTPKRLWGQRTQTLMTCLVIAIALGLPAFFYLAVVNLQDVSGEIEATGQTTVFLKHGVSEKEALALSGSVRNMADIESVDYISPQRALDEFKVKSGFGEVLDLLDQNPLPGVLLVLSRKPYRQDIKHLEDFVTELKKQPAVEDVLIDMRWLQRLNLLLGIARNLTLALGAALSLGVLLIVGNTIRLEIENRKEEIRVVKLIGGTDAYVRRPFLYTGFWYGSVGGVLAWCLVALVMFSVSGPVDELAGLYQSNFNLQGAGVLNLLMLVLIGAVLGLVGAFTAVGSHLSAVDMGQ